MKTDQERAQTLLTQVRLLREENLALWNELLGVVPLTALVFESASKRVTVSLCGGCVDGLSDLLAHEAVR